MTKAALEALVNAYLASSQPITASGMHKPSMQKVIDELYDANSRGAVMAGVDSSVSLSAGDKLFLIRSGVAKLVDISLFAQGPSFVFKGNHDISTNLFPASAVYGYVYYTGATASTTLEGQNGTGPIGRGSLLLCNKASGTASTTDPIDWIIIQTQY